MGTTNGHEAAEEAQAFSEDHTSMGEVMLEAFQPQENGEALAPVGMDSFHSSEDDMFGMGGDESVGTYSKLDSASDSLENIEFVGEIIMYYSIVKAGLKVGAALLAVFALDYGLKTFLSYTLAPIVLTTAVTIMVPVLKVLGVIGVVGLGIYVVGRIVKGIFDTVTFRI